MTFGSSGNWIAQDKTSGANWVYTLVTGQSMGVNKLAVLCLAKDNTSTTADGDNNEVTSVTDSKSNTWLQAVEFTNVQGGAAAGATVSIWYSTITTAVVVGDTVTFNFASCAAKALVEADFTRDTAKTIGIDQTGTLANDGADAGSISLSPGQGNIEYLFVRGTAHETAATTYTATTNYSSGANTVIATSGGGDASNMCGSMESRIFTTGSAEATDPSCTAVDHASAMVSFYEITAGGAGIPDVIMTPMIPT